MEIRRGTKEEFYTIIDFIDFVFSKAHNPHDFLRMYANLYLETDASMHNMINLWEDGQIIGSILSLPRTMVVGGVPLKVNGIGSVACHPRMGGRGVMSKLMQFNNAEMKKDGVHLSCLGGRRTRYNHFGYEAGGTRYSVEVSYECFKAKMPDFDSSTYRFVPFGAEDTEMIDRCLSLYKTKPIHYDYDRESFFLRLTIPCCDAAPRAVYRGEDFCGYISYTGGEDISVVELCLQEDSESAQVLLSLAAQNKKDLEIDFYEYQLPYFKSLGEISSLIEVEGSGMWQVLDWKAVLEALLTFKASYTALPEGSLVLGIGDEKYCVALQNGKATAVPTDMPADFTFGKLEAVPALTSPVPQNYFGMQGNAEKLTLARSWFPLPLARLFAERV